MKVLFASSAFSEKMLLDVRDAQILMGLLERARAVKSEYVANKGYVHTYIPRAASGEFTIVPNDAVQMPEDLKTMVQVKREMGQVNNTLPESYVMPDEGVNVE